jgi:multiple sugar transport system ATP-binding protein
MAEVRLEDLQKKYDNDTLAVKGVSFTANDGEFVVMVGPSGCGKSTTLRMVAGLEEITAGDLLIDGERMNDREPKDRDVAMVFQNYALYPHMTVFENMAFPLKMRKVDKKTIKQQVEDAAKLLSIEQHLNKKPKQLSGGERQRVAVGRAIVRKPKVFLFDEPLSNLDAALRTQMRAELKRLQRRLGATMLYVTHDQVEAMTMGDKIAVLNKGELEQFGTPKEIYERPATTFVARFLGSPAMNLIPGGIRREGGTSYFVHTEANPIELSLGRDIPEGNVMLGVRPEAVAISRPGHRPTESAHGTEFVKGKLVLIEPIGSVTHYYIEHPDAVGGTLVASVSHSGTSDRPGSTSKPGSSIAASLDPGSFSIGDTASFYLNPVDVHLFDRETGSRL